MKNFIKQFERVETIRSDTRSDTCTRIRSKSDKVEILDNSGERYFAASSPVLEGFKFEKLVEHACYEAQAAPKE